jgi:lysozyme family protein
MIGGYQTARAFVWLPQHDAPAQGYHYTTYDTGGPTLGGITQETWSEAVAKKIVAGDLARATNEQLSKILQVEFWGPVCDALPLGLDLLFFNGRMMTGRYPQLFQQALGFVGGDVDGSIGAKTLEAAQLRDSETLIHALTGFHVAYLRSLGTWNRFGNGWTDRLLLARDTAIAALHPTPKLTA